MKKTDAMIASAIAGLLSLPGYVAGADKPIVHCFERERCYGVVKAGQNDCATAASSCAGTSKQDYQKDAWVYLPKGSCAKLGGSIKPGASSKADTK